MSPKLFADDYEDAGEEALSRLALRGGGEGGSLYSFLFHFFIASSFPNPLPPSVWVVYPAGGGEQGWRCGVCVACIQSASATCITLLGDTVVVYGVEFESLSRNKIYVNQCDAL